MFGLNPWLIIGVMVAFLGFGTASYFKGRRDANDKWEIAISQQKLEAADVLLKSEKANAVKVAALNSLNDELEKNHADNLARIQGLRIANGRLLDATCGLYDRNGRRRESGGNVVSGDPAGATGAVEAPIGCLLPRPLVDALGDLAYDADTISEADAVLGHEYATRTAPLINARPH